jgi:polygalacturonase
MLLLLQRAALLASLASYSAAWLVVDVARDFGARGDNATDNTAAFRAALAAVAAAGGGEVIVPAAPPSVFQTGPFNLSTNVLLTVEGTVFAVADAAAFPRVAAPPSYLSSFPAWRHHPFVWAPNATNVTIRGGGEINGGGPYWWAGPEKTAETRPHLLELHNVTGAEVTGVTLHNSPFWTFRPIYCRDVWIHDMRIENPYGAGDTLDGIDVDSSQNVLVERNYINTGDDHVTVLAGAGASGRAFNMSSRNVTVRDNVLGTGMGMSVGSSVSGGVEDVVYERNVMTEGRYVNASTYGFWGQGSHIKTRVSYGGFIRRISFIDNLVYAASTQAILVETDYQSSGGCNATSCTEIRDILWRNLTVLIVGTGAGNGGPGQIGCYPERPCANFSFENININTTARWSCSNLTSITVTNVTPPGLAAACGLA